MRALFYFGWALLLAAFAAAASEALVRGSLATGGAWVAAHDLWYAMAPGSLVVTQIRIERIAPLLWDPVLRTLLNLPAWLLLGLPGVALTWGCRPGRQLTAREREDHRKHEESLLLYDELARDARLTAQEDGDPATEDDTLPDHDGHIALEELERYPPPTDEEIIAAIEAGPDGFHGRPPAGPHGGAAGASEETGALPPPVKIDEPKPETSPDPDANTKT